MERRLTNKRNRKDYLKQWLDNKRKTDPEYISEMNRKNGERNKERRASLTEEELKKEREKNCEREKKRRKDDPRKPMLYDARKRAKRKGLEFNLEFSDLVIPDICPVLNLPLKVAEGKRNNNSPSLDRVDNTKGYTKDNVKVISLRANTLKNDASIEELESIVKYMKENLCLGME